MGENNIFLHDPLPQFQLQREGDIFLMQCFLLAKPTDMELRRLMYYREYLQITTLSDITTVDGKIFLSQSWEGLQYKRKLNSVAWPRQPPRKHLDWQLWKNTLIPLLINTNTRILKYPLKQWKEEA